MRLVVKLVILIQELLVQQIQEMEHRLQDKLTLDQMVEVV
tara:strand:- start:98 stop:217 length:120 start_codon:yes stop_codon:yes gene_type:complete